MTKADDVRSVGVPQPHVYLWILPDAIAFAHTGGKKSLLGLTRCAAALVRAVAETRAGDAGARRVSRKLARDVAAELFVRASTQQPSTTVAQTHRPDVLLVLGATVELHISKLLVQAELERAASFVLSSAFRGCLTSGFVTGAVEFQAWLDDLVMQTRSAPIQLNGGQEP